MMNFKITGGKGFHIKFPNGVVLSTQFGDGNYCDNYKAQFDMNKNDWESGNVEIAIWKEKEFDEDWITREFRDNGDDVLGYVGIEEWLQAVEWCKNYNGG